MYVKVNNDLDHVESHYHWYFWTYVNKGNKLTLVIATKSMYMNRVVNLLLKKIQKKFLTN